MADPSAMAYLTVNPENRSDRLIVRKLNISMAPFQHDIAELVVQGVDDVDVTSWDTGVPLFITYGRAPNGLATFYGYILSFSRSWEQTTRLALPDRTMSITAVGASWPLKDSYQATLSGVSVDQIAATIASTYHLTVDAPPDSYQWPSKNVGGRTTFQFLTDIAKTRGRTFYVHGTEIRLYDPLTQLRRGNSVVPTFYEKDFGSPGSVLQMDTDTTEVSATEGRRKRTRNLAGLNIRTGQMLNAVDDGSTDAPPMAGRRPAPLFAEDVTDLVALDQSSANALLPARGVTNRFHIRAQARLTGDVRVTQESPIVMEGLGSRDSGIWQVLNVTHRIHKNWYSLEAELGRDSDYDNGIRPGLPANVARAQYDANQTIVFNDPPTVLVNGQWRAAYTSGQVLGAA